MPNDHKERKDYAETLYEPAIEDSKCFIQDKKPPVVTSYDDRWKGQTGGRSVPRSSKAPDGVSGSWK
ncbi:MAG: hypothetical protein IJA67_05370 [Oscillospiraceae bacterium]|nr:hypothetical protein [Oscillospiraceae bacterium]